MLLLLLVVPLQMIQDSVTYQTLPIRKKKKNKPKPNKQNKALEAPLHFSECLTKSIRVPAVPILQACGKRLINCHSQNIGFLRTRGPLLLRNLQPLPLPTTKGERNTQRRTWQSQCKETAAAKSCFGHNPLDPSTLKNPCTHTHSSCPSCIWRTNTAKALFWSS